MFLHWELYIEFLNKSFNIYIDLTELYNHSMLLLLRVPFYPKPVKIVNPSLRPTKHKAYRHIVGAF